MYDVTIHTALPLNDAVEEACNRSVLTGSTPAVLLVETGHSVYTVVIHGTDEAGYARATVACPAHPVNGTPAATLTGVVCRVLEDRLVVVDSDDVRRTVLRTSPIVATHLVSMVGADLVGC